jgi:group I intron endonuclease
MSFKIYKIINRFNGKSYVGFTSQKLSRRFYQHCTRPGCITLNRAIRKYGKSVFSISTLQETTDRDEALSLEKKYIIEHHTHLSEGGYNMNYGGCGSLPRKRPAGKWSVARHKAMSKMFHSIDRSYMQTEEYKSLMKSAKAGQNSGTRNPMFGKTGAANPKSKQYFITYQDGIQETIWGGKEKLNWLAAHHISPTTFQRMVHESEYRHPSGIVIRLRCQKCLL